MSTAKTQLLSRTAGGLQSLFQNLRKTYKHKLPKLTEGGVNQAAAAERRKKKLPNHLVRL
jgi:hypothetical protein